MKMQVSIRLVVLIALSLTTLFVTRVASSHHHHHHHHHGQKGTTVSKNKLAATECTGGKWVTSENAEGELVMICKMPPTTPPPPTTVPPTIPPTTRPARPGNNNGNANPGDQQGKAPTTTSQTTTPTAAPTTVSTKPTLPALINVTQWPQAPAPGSSKVTKVVLTIAGVGVAKCYGWECLLRAIYVNTCAQRCWGTKQTITYWTSQLLHLVVQALTGQPSTCRGRENYCTLVALFLKDLCAKSLYTRIAKRHTTATPESIDDVMARIRRNPTEENMAYELEHANLEAEYGKQFSINAEEILQNIHNTQLNGRKQIRRQRSLAGPEFQLTAHQHYVMWNKTQAACRYSAKGCSSLWFIDNLCVFKTTDFQ